MPAGMTTGAEQASFAGTEAEGMPVVSMNDGPLGSALMPSTTGGAMGQAQSMPTAGGATSQALGMPAGGAQALGPALFQEMPRAGAGQAEAGAPIALAGEWKLQLTLRGG